VNTIIDVAIEFDVDFISMSTAGHRNVLDVFRGSTTERVIHHAPCPVLRRACGIASGAGRAAVAETPERGATR
jgi:hypothetical protein